MMTLIDEVADGCTAFTPGLSASNADARRLGRAYAAADRGQFTDAIAELRAALLSFVEARKAEGQPPERMVVAMKRALVNFGGLSATSVTELGTVESAQRSELYDDVFRWTLEEYYAKK